jgi:hypothetical protein
MIFHHTPWFIVTCILCYYCVWNRVLKRIFGLKWDEVTGRWRKMHNEELRNLYSSQSIIRQIKSRRMRWAGYVVRMWVKRKVASPEVKILLGRSRRRLEDGIRMDLREIGWEGVEWMKLAQYRDRGGLLWMRWWTFRLWRHSYIYVAVNAQRVSACHKPFSGARNSLFSHHYHSVYGITTLRLP